MNDEKQVFEDCSVNYTEIRIKIHEMKAKNVTLFNLLLRCTR